MTETTPAESPQATAYQTPEKIRTPGGTTVEIPFKQATPKHGGIAEIATNQWAAWTGGAPSSDWSGLKNPKPSSIEPNRYRSSSISSQAKAQYYRTQGLETKFTRDGEDDHVIDARKAGTITWSVHEVANDDQSARIDICVEADASKREALLAFHEIERPNENLRALIPVLLGPEEDEEEEEEEEEVELVPFLGSSTPAKCHCVS